MLVDCICSKHRDFRSDICQTSDLECRLKSLVPHSLALRRLWGQHWLHSRYLIAEACQLKTEVKRTVKDSLPAWCLIQMSLFTIQNGSHKIDKMRMIIWWERVAAAEAPLSSGIRPCEDQLQSWNHTTWLHKILDRKHFHIVKNKLMKTWKDEKMKE